MEVRQTDMRWPSERERLVAAMAELCAEQGYEETTVADVVQRAQVSEESFAEIFSGGKEEAMVAAINAVLSDTLSTVSGTYSQDRSEFESALSVIKGILELMAAKPSGAYISFVVARQMGPGAAHEVYEAGTKMLTVVLERLWEYSESQVQPRNVARAALGGGEALVRREIVAGRAEQLPRLLPSFIYGATVPFLGQEEAMRMVEQSRQLLAGTRWADG